MIFGHCNCGEVTFKISGATTDIIVCHCSICRRSTGANGIPVLITKNEYFSWEKGAAKIANWRKPVGDWHTSFCSVCGSTLPAPNDEENMYIPAGLIAEGGENLKVIHHVFVKSKAAWDEIGDQGKIHMNSFGGS